MPNHEGSKFRIPRTVRKSPTDDTLVNIAYFPGWTQFRGQGRSNCHQRPYLPSSIPWSSLDYVMFAFVYFDHDGKLYPADPSDESLYFDINKLKMPTRTRVMISIGGWSFTHPDSKRDDTQNRFENMIRSRSARKAFIDGCIEFCRFYGFDGVDIDYEYPAYRDREFVTALFKEMRQAFDDEGSGFVLSLAGASFREGIQGFELDKVSQYTDFIMIMTYDLYGSYDSSHVVNIHTALVQTPTEAHSGHSVQGAVELYLDQGVPHKKIVLGLALYGKTFVLADTSETHPGKAKFSAGGDPTSCIETRGDIAYNEIANLIHSPHQESRGQDSQPIRPQWDPDSRAFYFVYGDRRNNWVGYDDRPSLDLKLQLVTELDLAGVMWWSLDQD
ncbi:glycoside hydrolase, partial [Dissophora ornata]